MYYSYVWIELEREAMNRDEQERTVRNFSDTASEPEQAPRRRRTQAARLRGDNSEPKQPQSVYARPQPGRGYGDEEDEGAYASSSRNIPPMSRKPRSWDVGGEDERPAPQPRKQQPAQRDPYEDEEYDDYEDEAYEPYDEDEENGRGGSGWWVWLLIVVLVAALLAGAVWGFLPAFFKAKWNTNETLFTLMMNYIAMQLASYFIIVWEVPKGAGKIGIINQDTRAGWLPEVGNSYLLPILIVGIMTVLMYVYLQYSKHGYEIAVVGESQRTASYAGIKVDRVIIRTMVLSGALCAMMGFIMTAGIDHTLTTTIVNSRGFTAVMVSWMSKFNPFIMIASSLLLVTMDRGASEVASTLSLNHSFADILTGIILFFIIATEFFITYKVTLRKSSRKEA